MSLLGSFVGSPHRGRMPAAKFAAERPLPGEAFLQIQRSFEQKRHRDIAPGRSGRQMGFAARLHGLRTAAGLISDARTTSATARTLPRAAWRRVRWTKQARGAGEERYRTSRASRKIEYRTGRLYIPRSSGPDLSLHPPLAPMSMLDAVPSLPAVVKGKNSCPLPQRCRMHLV